MMFPSFASTRARARSLLARLALFRPEKRVHHPRARARASIGDRHPFQRRLDVHSYSYFIITHASFVNHFSRHFISFNSSVMSSRSFMIHSSIHPSHSRHRIARRRRHSSFVHAPHPAHVGLSHLSHCTRRHIRRALTIERTFDRVSSRMIFEHKNIQKHTKTHKNTQKHTKTYKNIHFENTPSPSTTTVVVTKTYKNIQKHTLRAYSVAVDDDRRRHKNIQKHTKKYTTSILRRRRRRPSSSRSSFADVVGRVPVIPHECCRDECGPKNVIF